MGAGNSKELTSCQVDRKSLEKDLERAKDEFEEKQAKVVEDASKRIEKITEEKEKQKDEAIAKAEKQKDEAIEMAEKQFNLNLNQQKKFYEEKLLSIRKQLEQAEKLSSVAYTSLEEKYGEERAKRQKLSDEMFMVRQKLKNLDTYMQQQVRGAYRAIDTNYGKQQIYNRFFPPQAPPPAPPRQNFTPNPYQPSRSAYPQQGGFQQPAYQQPAYQQPTYQQPTYQQPAYQQPPPQQPYSFYR